MGGPNSNDVAGWIEAVEIEIGELDAALTPLVEKHAALTERLGLLKRLMSSLTDKGGNGPAETAAIGSLQTARASASIRERVQAHAREILTEAGRPLHINEIHGEFIKRGFEVPGAGKPNNITVHLADAAGIVSTARGYYGAQAVEVDSEVRYPVVDESMRKRARG